jgi:hypothetical protein
VRGKHAAHGAGDPAPHRAGRGGLLAVITGRNPNARPSRPRPIEQARGAKRAAVAVHPVRRMPRFGNLRSA